MNASKERPYQGGLKEGAGLPAEKLRILIVDTSKVILEIISSEFSSSLFEVQKVSLVEEAALLARENKFDLITLGIYLEGGTGFDLCGEIRSKGKKEKFASSEARIIFVTSDFTEENRMIAHNAGADGFIEKSQELSSFQSTIDEIIKDLIQEKKIPSQKNPNLAKRKVLIIDDSELNLMLFRRLLESKGAEVQTAISGKHALQILEEKPKDFAAIFTDMYMPGMNGNEFCSIVQKNPAFSQIRLGITSAAEESSLALDKVPSGVELFSKPYDIQEICNFLK
ncbi:response regulator [Leptospira johnsonii]|uniref:Response regulator receiver domain protein n=1 Tax=Leptospira johnsonii TaxID=1917820 RepID=A0A2P2D5R3_9LEPT|nr:response regulator [Leptospira johnsonii]GBF39952.1 response regulator receiver domain protein [Leptospira johnsonii]